MIRLVGKKFVHKFSKVNQILNILQWRFEPSDSQMKITKKALLAGILRSKAIFIGAGMVIFFNHCGLELKKS